MLMFSCVGLLISLIAAPLEGELKEYSSKDGKYSIKLLPGAMEQKIPTPAGNFTAFAAQVGQGAALAGYMDVPIPEGEDENTIKRRLEGGRDGALQNTRGKLIKSSFVKSGNLLGIEFLGEMPGPGGQTGLIKARFFIKGTRMYQIMVLGAKDFVEQKTTDEILRSFKVSE